MRRSVALSTAPLLSLAWLAALPACAVEPAAPGSVPQALGQAECDDFLCGSNTTLRDGLSFWQLRESGVPLDGFAISNFWLAGEPLHGFDVAGAWPRLYRPNQLPVSGSQLVNMTATLATPNGPVPLWFKEYKRLEFWDGGISPRAAAFRIQYLDTNPDPQGPGPSTQWRDLCPYERVDEQGMAGTWVILSQGDRYDIASNTIMATGAAVGDYFNVSCAGSVPGKLVRMRHAYAVQDGQHPTKLAQRIAALKMFTADYCGTGARLYTQPGQPLTWEDYAGWSQLGAHQSEEAIWTDQGARCLVEPRLVDPAEIECDIPVCTAEELASWRSLGWLLSAIP